MRNHDWPDTDVALASTAETPVRNRVTGAIGSAHALMGAASLVPHGELRSPAADANGCRGYGMMGGGGSPGHPKKTCTTW